jgi:hypothetical protein
MLVKDYIVRGNFANSNQVNGSQWVQIAEMHLPGPATVTVGTTYIPFSNTIAGPAAQPRVLIRIRHGTGGGYGVVYTLAGTPKKVTGQTFFVEASVWLDENGTIPAEPGDNVKTTVFAYFADGEGQDLQPTTWSPSFFGGMSYVGSFETLFVGPGRMRQAIGYNHSANPTWLMFFDWPWPTISPATPPLAGTQAVPILIVPIPGAPASPGIDPYFSFDAIESKKDFVYGCAFATSSTGDSFTYDNTGLVHVDLEIYQGDRAA